MNSAHRSGLSPAEFKAGVISQLGRALQAQLSALLPALLEHASSQNSPPGPINTYYNTDSARAYSIDPTCNGFTAKNRFSCFGLHPHLAMLQS